MRGIAAYAVTQLESQNNARVMPLVEVAQAEVCTLQIGYLKQKFIINI